MTTRTRTQGRSAVVIVALVLGAAALPHRPARPTVLAAGPAPTGLLPVASPKGAGSCAAQACHGGTAPLAPTVSAVLRNEHTTWMTRDRHTQAYAALLEPRSVAIMRKLGWPTPAHKEARCLACHATPTGNLPEPEAEAIRQDGVGCEACHGPSERWLSAHTIIGFRDQSPADKLSKFGLIPLQGPADRARACAGCHVGAPAEPERGYPVVRDVNHDLIAAGHPRLSFEMVAYHDLEAKHWVETQPAVGFRAALWAVGQVASARSALALLASRADAAGAGSPWPEFSEYGCFACHFHLDIDRRWRPEAAGRDKADPIGRPPWGTWTHPMLRALASSSPNVPPGLPPLLGQLRATMNQAEPPTAEVAALARQAVALLDAWLGAPIAVPAGLVGTFAPPADGPRRWQATSWDDAAQRYLALRALNRPNIDPGLPNRAAAPADAALESELNGLLEILKFAPGLDSPGSAAARTGVPGR